MLFDPFAPPQPSYYKEWNALRKARTQEMIQTQNVITSDVIRKKLLSLSMICDAGFTQNAYGDMEKK